MDKKVFDTFKSPGVEWRGKPFWAWNGDLKKEELIRQVGVMKKMGFGGYFMHSRCGLITEYLGDEWFELTNAVADAGTKAGMENWLYDRVETVEDIPVISLKGLKEMKLSLGREKDLRDVALIDAYLASRG